MYLSDKLILEILNIDVSLTYTCACEDFRQSKTLHLVFRYRVIMFGTFCFSCLFLDGMVIFENDVQ